MPTADTFTRLADGTTLLRHEDGTFRPVVSETNELAVRLLSDEQIECMAAHDPGHPALDDNFWASVDTQAIAPSKEAVSLRLDEDVLNFFRNAGQGYQTQINAVLRRFMEAQRK